MFFFQKVKVVPFNSGSPESLYSELLTSYASAYVTKQLAILHKVKLVSIMSDACTVQTQRASKQLLPFIVIVLFEHLWCYHAGIFLLFVKHWINPCFFLNYVMFDGHQHTILIARKLCSILLLHLQLLWKFHRSKQLLVMLWASIKKYRKATYLTSELESIVSESSGIHFDHKMKFLKELIDLWKCGQEVAITEVDEGNS